MHNNALRQPRSPVRWLAALLMLAVLIAWPAGAARAQCGGGGSHGSAEEDESGCYDRGESQDRQPMRRREYYRELSQRLGFIDFETSNGDAVPNIQFRTDRGRRTTIRDYDGEVVVLNFWASWCEPCVRELPLLDQLQHSFGEDDLSVVALSVDEEDLHRVRHAIRLVGFRYLDVFYDEERALADAMGVNIIPTTVIVDKAGREVGRLAGVYNWTSPEFANIFRFLIETTPPR